MSDPIEPQPTEPAPQAPADPAPPVDDPPAPQDPAAPADEPKSYDEAYVKKLRDENAAARVKAKSAADEARKSLAQEIGKAIGLVQDDEPADPEALMQQLTTKDGELKQKTVELALVRTAGRLSADAEELMDSKGFMRTVEKLDHSSEDFMTALEAAIKDALAANPKKYSKPTAGQVPPQSGGEITGGSGEQRPKNDEDLSIDDLRTARRKARGVE